MVTHRIVPGMLASLLMILPLAQAAEKKTKPCPPLFTVARTTNRNFLFYEAKLKDGKLDPDEPIQATWRMLEKGQEVYEDLTWFEKRSAYGIEVLENDGNRATILVMAIKDMRIDVEPGRRGSCHRAHVWFSGKRRVRFERAYVHVDEGFFPSVEKVTLYGRLRGNNRPVEETLKP